MRKTIEQRIRDAAKSKLITRITGRTRCDCGFDVVFPVVDDTGPTGQDGFQHDCIHVSTKAEGLSLLLAKARCLPKLTFEIRPVKAKELKLPWCVACKKAHMLPLTKEHHEALKCRAKWEKKCQEMGL